MQIRPLRVDRTGQIIFALALLAIGLVAIFIAQGYRLGQLNNIGPGTIPLALGGVLSFLAIIVLIESINSPEPSLDIRFEPILLIPLGIITWALIIEQGGLLPATMVLVALYALSERPFRPVMTILLGLSLSVIGALIFIYGFNLPFSFLGE